MTKPGGFLCRETGDYVVTTPETPRERFLASLTFGHPGRVTFSPGMPRESTLAAWHRQGLPEGADYCEHLHEILGIEPESSQEALKPDVSFAMIPEFEEEILAHKDGHYIVRDWMGAVTEIEDRFDPSYLRSAKDFVTRKWHKFPVEERPDWIEMKQRYVPDTPGRFPSDFEECCAALRNRDNVVGIDVNGPFWQLREWLGFERLCMTLIDDPSWIAEMIEFWTFFVSVLLARILARVEPDYVCIHEDMAYKGHSMISPDMTRRFLLPCYQRWVPEIRKSCPIVDLDSDGYIEELIPIWIEAGINCCDPVEVAAHNDIVKYRRSFGRDMAFRGGIDKRAIAAGGGTMTGELRRVVPPLLAGGGFIPGCDHGVPPDITWPAYVEYACALAGLTGWL